MWVICGSHPNCSVGQMGQQMLPTFNPGIKPGSPGLQHRSANIWPTPLTPFLDIVLYLKLLPNPTQPNPFPNPNGDWLNIHFVIDFPGGL